MNQDQNDWHYYNLLARYPPESHSQQPKRAQVTTRKIKILAREEFLHCILRFIGIRTPIFKFFFQGNYLFIQPWSLFESQKLFTSIWQNFKNVLSSLQMQQQISTASEFVWIQGDFKIIQVRKLFQTFGTIFVIQKGLNSIILRFDIIESLHNYVKTMKNSSKQRKFSSYQLSLAIDVLFCSESDISDDQSPQGKTTLMLRNIPNRMSNSQLQQVINQGFHKKFDFLYLPIDSRTKNNFGYAFVNLVGQQQALQFKAHFQGFRWKQSDKIGNVCLARIQGKHNLIKHIEDKQSSSLVYY